MLQRYNESNGLDDSATRREQAIERTALTDAFLHDAGAATPLRFTLYEPGEPVCSIESAVPFALVGQHPAALIRPRKAVLRRLFYLQVLAGRLFCVPLTKPEVSPVGNCTKPGWLPLPARLEFDQTVLQCEFTPLANLSSPVVEDPLEERFTEFDPLPKLTADILINGVRQSRWRMNRMLALAGRSPGIRVQLTHNSVSRLHCSFVRLPGSVWVVDLLSSKGTLVNGRSVPFARLQAGDTVTIGCYQFHFPNEETAVPSPSTVPVPTVLRGVPLPNLNPAESQTILPIIQQFGLIHQQMMDQFQQTMLMTVQMFGKMHAEQLELIRDELDQLMRLTRELEQARQELASRKAGPATATTPPTRRVAPELPPPEPVKPAPENTRTTSTGSSEPAEVVEEWLTERIANLEQERQSIWQRLLGTLTGR